MERILIFWIIFNLIGFNTIPAYAQKLSDGAKLIELAGDHVFTDQNNTVVYSVKNVSEKLKMKLPIRSGYLVGQENKATIFAILILYKFNDDLSYYELKEIALSDVKEFSQPNVLDELCAEIDMTPYSYDEKMNMFVRVFLWENYQTLKPLYPVSQQYSDLH